MEKWKFLLLFIFLVPRSTHCYTYLSYEELKPENAYISKLVAELDDILPKIVQEHTSLYAGHQACPESLNQLKEKKYRHVEYGLFLLSKIRDKFSSLKHVIHVRSCY